MKRAASSILVMTSIPLGVLFVLTARPARLYAEVAFDSGPSCAAPTIQACTGKAIADTCSYDDGGSGVCDYGSCRDPDGGSMPSIGCLLGYQACAAVQLQVQECAGKALGNSCTLVSGNADSGVCTLYPCLDPDSGWNQPVVCEPAPPPLQPPDSGDSDVWQVPLDGSYSDALPPDGGSGAVAPSPPGAAAAQSDHGGCNATGTSPTDALGAGLGLLLAFTAMLGLRQRPTKR